MKERPILFSAPMVRAILDGRKTVTLRVVKPQPMMGVTRMLAFKKPRGPDYWIWPNGRDEITAMCPYGQPGDRLWVREACAETDLGDGTPVVAYRADNVAIPIGRNESHGPDHLIHSWAQPLDGVVPDRWRPSIHMPRWASRILLEVTDVRVERLGDISEQQALDEGVDNKMCAAAVGKSPYKAGPCTIMGFAHLWESINGPGSWNANPWVWVVEFKRVTPAVPA